VRWVRGKPVVFGEGNLISNQTAACCPAAAQDGLIALLDFVANERRVRVKRVRYLPTWVSHPDYTVLGARRGSLSWRRTVSVAGRRRGIGPVRRRSGGKRPLSRARRADASARRSAASGAAPR
jgi:hypothetical protein